MERAPPVDIQLATISQGLPADVLVQLADTTSSDQTLDNAPLTRKEKMVVGALGAGAGIGMGLKAYQAQLKNKVMESILEKGGLSEADIKLKIKDPKGKMKSVKNFLTDQLMGQKQQEKIQDQMKERAKKAVEGQSKSLNNQIKLLKKGGIIDAGTGKVIDTFDPKNLTMLQENALDALKKMNPTTFTVAGKDASISKDLLESALLKPMDKLKAQKYDTSFLEEINKKKQELKEASDTLLKTADSDGWYARASKFLKRKANTVKSWFGKGGAKEAFETFLKKDLAKAL